MTNLIVAMATSAVIMATQPSGVYPSLGSLELEYVGENLEYSVDGSDYREYTQPIYIFDNSDVSVRSSTTGITEQYSYKLKANVKASVPAGTYYTTQVVRLMDVPRKATVYYTLDGSKPTVKSEVMPENGITISESCFLRTLTVKENWTDSYKSFKYNIVSPKEKSIEDDYTIKYCYMHLNDADKRVYEAILNAVRGHDKFVSLPLGYSYAELDSIAIQVASDNPSLFWFEGYMSYTVGNNDIRGAISYNLSAEEVEQYKEPLEQEIIKLQQLSSWATCDKDKINSLLIPIAYSNSSNTGYLHERTPVGTLLENASLCAGKTQTLAWVLQRCGYQTLYRFGYCDDGVYHIWLAVKLGNSWYNIDPSYKTSVSTLVSDDNMIGIVKFQDYFSVPKMHNFMG